MDNVILLTGGTGKTGRRIATKLKARGKTVRLASRSAVSDESFEGVQFDWIKV